MLDRCSPRLANCSPCRACRGRNHLRAFPRCLHRRRPCSQPRPSSARCQPRSEMRRRLCPSHPAQQRSRRRRARRPTLSTRSQIRLPLSTLRSPSRRQATYSTCLEYLVFSRFRVIRRFLCRRTSVRQPRLICAPSSPRYQGQLRPCPRFLTPFRHQRYPDRRLTPLAEREPHLRARRRRSSSDLRWCRTWRYPSARSTHT
jgi:hypothetical protein